MTSPSKVEGLDAGPKPLVEGGVPYSLSVPNSIEGSKHAFELSQAANNPPISEPAPISSRSITAAQGLLAERWAKPTYWERFNALVQARVKGDGIVQAHFIEKQLVGGMSEMRPDDFSSLLKEVAGELGTTIYDQLKVLRNVVGAPFAIHEAWVKGGAAQKVAGSLSGLAEGYKRLVGGTRRSLSLCTVFFELDRLRDSKTGNYKASDIQESIQLLRKDEKAFRAALSSEGKAAFDALMKIDEKDADAIVSGLAVDTLLGVLKDDQQAENVKMRDLLFDTFIDIKAEEAKKQGVSVTREALKEQYAGVFTESLESQLAGGALSAQSSKHFLGRLAWSGAILFVGGVEILSMLFKTIGLFGLPIALSIGQALGAFCDVMHAGLYGESLRLDATKAYESHSLEKKTHAYLSQLEKEGRLPKAHAMRDSGQSAPADLKAFELKALAKGIKRQQDVLGRGLAAASMALGFLGAGVSIVVIGLKLLTLAGLIAGGALAVASPIGWSIIGAGVAVTLIYGLYSAARWAHNKYNQLKWEACLREASEQGAPTNGAELAQRSELYQKLYLKAQSLGLKDEGAHEYVYRRTYSRVLQYDYVLLVDTLYERLHDREDMDVRRLLGGLNLMQDKMMTDVALADREQKAIVVDYLNKALGFA